MGWPKPMGELLINLRNQAREERPLDEGLQRMRDAASRLAELEGAHEQRRTEALGRLMERAQTDEVLTDLLMVLGLTRGY
jgi:ribosomal 50S subunit-associated protein YjgA (DUF615 family)